MSHASQASDKVSDAVLEVQELMEGMAPDYYDRYGFMEGPKFTHKSPEHLKELAADYAHNDERCPTFNDLNRPEQDLVMDLVEEVSF